MGFNDISLARDAAVEGWSKTVFQVVQQLHERTRASPNHFILNPVYGPEPVAGSTRMKGSD
jgi:hypothetical protein